MDPWVLTINGVASFTAQIWFCEVSAAWVKPQRKRGSDRVWSGNRTHELDPYAQIDSGSDLVWIQLSKMTDDGGLVRSDPTAD